MDANETVHGRIVGSNRGGAVVEAEGVQGFIPLSQLVGPARELYVPGGEPPKEGFIGMEVEFKIIELNRRRNRAIFSERAALQAWEADPEDAAGSGVVGKRDTTADGWPESLTLAHS